MISNKDYDRYLNGRTVSELTYDEMVAFYHMMFKEWPFLGLLFFEPSDESNEILKLALIEKRKITDDEELLFCEGWQGGDYE